jgi:predicted lipid carrier protein YhbT
LSLLGQSLPMVVGKRVAPPVGTTVTVEVPDAGLAWTVRVGEDGRCVPVDDAVESTTTVRLSPEDLVLLAGGRRTPDSAQAKIEGDDELGHQLLRTMAVTP